MIPVHLPESYPLQKVTATTEFGTDETEESVRDDKGSFQKQHWHMMTIKLAKSEKENLNSDGIHGLNQAGVFVVVVVGSLLGDLEV